jgi:hypothetical protein
VVGQAIHRAPTFGDRPGDREHVAQPWADGWWLWISATEQVLVGRSPADPKRLAVEFPAPWIQGGAG